MSKRWKWSFVIVIVAAGLALWPQVPWFHGELTISTESALRTEEASHQMYEIASIASFGAAITLGLLSLAIPLLLLYFGQVVDGLQSVLQMVFDATGRLEQHQETAKRQAEQGRLQQRDISEVKNRATRQAELECLGSQLLSRVRNTLELSNSIMPVFRIIVVIAVSVLLYLLISHYFWWSSITYYSSMVRCFDISVWLSINAVRVLWILARERYLHKRLYILERLTINLHPELKVEVAQSFRGGKP